MEPLRPPQLQPQVKIWPSFLKPSFIEEDYIWPVVVIVSNLTGWWLGCASYVVCCAGYVNRVPQAIWWSTST